MCHAYARGVSILWFQKNFSVRLNYLGEILATIKSSFTIETTNPTSVALINQHPRRENVLRVLI